MASLFLLLMPLTFSFFFFLQTSSAHNNNNININTNTNKINNTAQAPSQILDTKTSTSSNHGDIASGHPSPSSSPPPNERPSYSPFRPSIAVIVGGVTTMFSITFLLLLYAKHCKRGNLVVVVGHHHNHHHQLNQVDRKNSGIDRAVVEFLPVFRFGSLMGHKDGLECAVCLNRFESSEVLRLLPKCKHAFHVECVDTWLDAHSTCPLCRYRVDPEDILLIDDAKISPTNDVVSEPRNDEDSDPGIRRVSGRHSSAGEKGTNGLVQIVVQKPGEVSVTNGSSETMSFRRSLDDWSLRKKRDHQVQSVAVGCFDRSRKDGLLLTTQDRKTSSDQQRSRFEHRILVSPLGGLHQRWSDAQPSDLLYLRSEMIISDSRRFSSASGSRPSVTRPHLVHQNGQVALHLDKDGKGQEDEEGGGSTGIDGSNSNNQRWSNSSGRRVINSRSVSEITGLSRYSNDNGRGSNDNHQRQHRRNHQRQRQQAQAGLMSRWVAWVSQLRPGVGSERNAL